jgi:hypothetical protein
VSRGQQWELALTGWNLPAGWAGTVATRKRPCGIKPPIRPYLKLRARSAVVSLGGSLCDPSCPARFRWPVGWPRKSGTAFSLATASTAPRLAAGSCALHSEQLAAYPVARLGSHSSRIERCGSAGARSHPPQDLLVARLPSKGASRGTCSPPACFPGGSRPLHGGVRPSAAAPTPQKPQWGWPRCSRCCTDRPTLTTPGCRASRGTCRSDPRSIVGSPVRTVGSAQRAVGLLLLGTMS